MALAQRVRILGGAQFEHMEASYNAVCWSASPNGNFKPSIDSRRLLSARVPAVQPFMHALLGAPELQGQGGFYAFAMLVGGGLDASVVAKAIGLRLVPEISLRSNPAARRKSSGKSLRRFVMNVLGETDVCPESSVIHASRAQSPTVVRRLARLIENRRHFSLANRTGQRGIVALILIGICH